MLSAVLIVSSTRVHIDAPEILRIQDTAATLLQSGCAVDLLVPRSSPLLTAAMPAGVQVFTAPRIPFCGNPPNRPSLRRLLTALVLFFRCVSLVSRRNYSVLHGFNDGSLVIRATDRVTVHQYPYICEIHRPLTTRGFFKRPCAVIARALERSALKYAAAIILPDKHVLSLFKGQIPKARVSLIPDPQTDECDPSEDLLSYSEYTQAILHVYDYVLRPRPAK